MRGGVVDYRDLSYEDRIAELQRAEKRATWEILLVDGEGDIPSGFTASEQVALYVGDTDVELMYGTFEGGWKTSRQELLRRISTCLPPLGTLYRMEVQAVALETAGIFRYESDDPVERAEQVVSVMAAHCTATGLPAVLVQVYVPPLGETRLAMYGLRIAPLHEQWARMVAVAIHTLKQIEKGEGS